MTALDVILLLHAASTVAMTGLVWFVQVVHYPLMRRVGAGGFVLYERQHTRRTTWVVAPLMLVEATTAVVIAAAAPTDGTRALAWMGLALLTLIWLSTALLQVPCHRRLESGFDERVLARLVATNWGRTAAWTLRSVLAFGLLWIIAVT
jgi:hypothetical protein